MAEGFARLEKAFGELVGAAQAASH
jgi:hypothetical protein